MNNQSSNDSFIELHRMGKDYFQVIDRANNNNSIFIRFTHNDSEEIRIKKINESKEKLIVERIKSTLKTKNQ
ncbi:protein of unknown function [Tenacibaculum sp. 190524A02b]